MSTKPVCSALALCLSALLLDPDIVLARGPAFSAGEPVQTMADAASVSAYPGPVIISDLVITESGSPDPIVSLRRGQSYVFWLQFRQAICSPYINQITFVKGGQQTFEFTWESEEHYCDIGAVGISVKIADDASFGKYHWAGRNMTYYGKDAKLRAAFQVIDAP